MWCRKTKTTKDRTGTEPDGTKQQEEFDIDK